MYVRDAIPCIYKCTYTHIHIYTYTHIHIYTYAHIHIYTYTHIHVYIYIYIYIIAIIGSDIRYVISEGSCMIYDIWKRYEQLEGNFESSVLLYTVYNMQYAG